MDKEITKQDLQTIMASFSIKTHGLDNEDSEEIPTSGDSKTKNATVTLDVTKALLLLGFTSWSAAEEGMDKLIKH